MANISGTAVNDMLYGTGDSDTISGGDGNDVLYGQGGDDTLIGGAGNDQLSGGEGIDFMVGGEGNDTYYIEQVGDYALELADEGIDTVVSYLANYALSSNIEILKLGGTGDINGSGNNLNNAIQGNSGDNTLNGRDGDDTLYGMNGDDTLNGGAGKDLMNGGAGTDEATYVGATAGVIVSLATTGWQNTVGAGVDRLVGIENLQGSSYNDRLQGNDGDNKISGGDGDDAIAGGFGDDDLTGGAGADVFIFEGTANNGVDFIRQFEVGVDLLYFYSHDGYDLAAGFTYGTEAVGAGAQFVYDTALDLLYYDADGAGGADATLLAQFASPIGGDITAADIFVQV